MADQKFIELASTIFKGEATNEQKYEFVQAIDYLRQKGATNPMVHWEINEIIVKTANEIIKPKLNFLDYIAETQMVGFGEKIEFNIPQKTKMQMRYTARGTTVDYQRVGNQKTYTAEPKQMAGGAYYEISQLLAGNIKEFTGVVDSLVNSMMNQITKDVFAVLRKAMAGAPAANRWVGANITLADFDGVANVIHRYGNPTAIADIEFAKKLAALVGADFHSDRMKELRNSSGYLTNVNGVDIVVFNNPFAEDDTDNTKTAAPKEFSYIVPTGVEMPIKIGFEGDMQQYTKTDIDFERVFLKATQLVSVDAFHDLRNIGELQDTSLV